ncbi:hypothetical protein BFW38_04615 [Terasakiispira papahanaumokuakeensis]|uniref:Methyltransferase domain-containing protein n=1 Tax=Terasakiispira papahanaumokuakeensis TaxID=197479 RepID=A0A1E2V8F4_9GAMM|nr:methyltransferase [Terasakiispira papahanaumokuakeensis]ODC02935.1 hypothetical protein BFW38_04615 [Terasakiispira papahanaumokuakeensis]
MTTPPTRYRQTFTALTTLLTHWQWLWRPLPFMQQPVAWQTQWPELYARCLALSDDTLAHLEATPPEHGDSAWRSLAEGLPLQRLQTLTDWPEALRGHAPSPGTAEGISERKWQQLHAYLQAASPTQGTETDTHWVDWCAGKGHLAQLWAKHTTGPITALEYDAQLCQQGADAAKTTSIEFVHQDVLDDSVIEHLHNHSHILALHACGDLHRRAITLLSQTGQGLTLAPCCYHRTVDAHYRPLSAYAQQLSAQKALHLSRQDLALAVQETVTAPGKVQQQRLTANAWRQGFDALQRHYRQHDEYLPIPSRGYRHLKDGFQAFCEWAAEQKSIALLASIDWPYWEQLGWQRYGDTRRLELVRHIFRRPLEIWLVLDRVIYLEEQGFDVTLTQFCPRHLTPRNLLIRATRA